MSSLALISPLLCSTKYKYLDERQTELSSYLVFLTESSLFQSSKINSHPFIFNLPPLFLLSTLGLKMARLLRSEISQHTSDHKPSPSSPPPQPNQTTQQITKQKYNSQGDRDYVHHVFATAAAAAKQAEA